MGIEHTILQGLVGRIENNEPASVRGRLLKALRASLGIGLSIEEPRSPLQICEELDLNLGQLAENRIILTKDEAVHFLRLLGYVSSEGLLKKKFLKQGRYVERFGRDLAVLGTANVYTYAELLVLVDRPRLMQRLHEAAAEVIYEKRK